MLKLTLEETLAAHKEMWNWLAENPAVTKHEYPPFKELYAKGLHSEVPFHMCFLCEYAFGQIQIGDDLAHYCDYCPLDWDVFKNITSYMCEESFYGEWRDNYTNPDDITPEVCKSLLQTRKQLAVQIAGLPKKE